MSTPNLSSVLQNTEYFSTHTPEQLASLIPHFQLTQLGEDETVFEERSVGDAWFLVIDGEVVVTKQSLGRPDHDLSHLGPGEGFGEMALIDGSARMAAVQTTRPSTLASLPRAAFTSLLNDNDPGATLLLRNMAAVLCQRLREMTYILQDVVDDPGPRIQVAPETIRDVIKAVLLQN